MYICLSTGVATFLNPVAQAQSFCQPNDFTQFISSTVALIGIVVRFVLSCFSVCCTMKCSGGNTWYRECVAGIQERYVVRFGVARGVEAVAGR